MLQIAPKRQTAPRSLASAGRVLLGGVLVLSAGSLARLVVMEGEPWQAAETPSAPCCLYQRAGGSLVFCSPLLPVLCGHPLVIADLGLLVLLLLALTCSAEQPPRGRHLASGAGWQTTCGEFPGMPSPWALLPQSKSCERPQPRQPPGSANQEVRVHAVCVCARARSCACSPRAHPGTISSMDKKK